MAWWKLFSKRQVKPDTDGNAIYQCHSIPAALRTQIVYIFNDALGQFWPIPERAWATDAPSNIVWDAIYRNLVRELGKQSLSDSVSVKRPDFQVVAFIQEAPPINVLDAAELALRAIDLDLRDWVPYLQGICGIQLDADSAIQEFNQRFQEHGVGFRYSDGHILRVDSDFTHTAVVEPALTLLHQNEFRGPSEEFHSAFEHYRHGRNKEAIVDALKAFESTMIAICEVRGWRYKEGATAKQLVETLLANGLVPQQLESQFTGLRSAMESGLPTIRNRQAGHGQGLEPKEVPDHMVAFGLHLTAANIVFLVQAHTALGCDAR